MKLKCPTCRGCMAHEIIDYKHYFRCDFCKKYFTIRNTKVIEVNITYKGDGKLE